MAVFTRSVRCETLTGRDLDKFANDLIDMNRRAGETDASFRRRLMGAMEESDDVTELAKLSVLVDEFSLLLKDRLALKVQEGRRGWDERNDGMLASLRDGLQVKFEAYFKGEPPRYSQQRKPAPSYLVDVAAYAALLWHQHGRPK